MSGPGNIQVSGSSSYNEAATQIITDAYRICAVTDDTEDPSASMFRSAMTVLNGIIKELEATGIHVWTEEEAILFLQAGQTRYLLGGPDGSPDHCADAYNYSLSILSASAAISATSVTLADVVGMSVGDNFGVVLDTGTAYWTTIRTIVGQTVTFATGASLPSSASYQNAAFAYTTNIERPLKVPAGRRLTYQGLIETPLTKMISRQEYMDQPNKNSPGTVTEAFYNPARDQGELYVWPAPQDATNGIRFTWYRPIQDFLTTTDAPDLPQEWLNALTWNLALELAPRYAVSAARWDRITAMAAQKLELMRGWDREATSIYFGLSYDQTMR